MKTVKTIDGTLAGRLALGLHADLQMRLYEKISKMAPEKMLLEAADLDAWKRDIDVESDAARAVEASEATDRLKKKDEERDHIVSSLFEEIRQAAKSPIAQRAEAGRQLKLVVDTYKGLQTEGMGQETAHITGLLTDLGKSDVKGFVSALGLTQLVTMLRTANSEFDDIRTGRIDVKAADVLPKSKIIRRKNDETTFAIFRHIEAAHLIAATDADRKPLADLIDRINLITGETKISHHETAAAAKMATQKKREERENMLKPMLPAFEKDLGLPAGSLTFTGHSNVKNNKRRYEFAIAGSEKTVWALVNKDHLVEVVSLKPKM